MLINKDSKSQVDVLLWFYCVCEAIFKNLSTRIVKRAYIVLPGYSFFINLITFFLAIFAFLEIKKERNSLSDLAKTTLYPNYSSKHTHRVHMHRQRY